MTTATKTKTATKPTAAPPEPAPGSTIAVWFSCGAASAVAAKLTLDRWGDTCTVRIINNPVAEEDPDNRRFLADVERWLGVPIEIAINPKYPNCSAVEVWEKKRKMSFVTGYAPCTDYLKKRARQYWEGMNLFNFALENCLVMGFTAEELDRHERFTLTERPNLLPVLIDAGLSKADCFRIVQQAGIELPSPYRKGLNNANCIGCVKATSPTYWNTIRREYPQQFAERSEQSRRLGVRLVELKGQRIFLDELDPAAVGRPLKTMDFECGIFCEERPASLPTKTAA